MKLKLGMTKEEVGVLDAATFHPFQDIWYVVLGLDLGTFTDGVCTHIRTFDSVDSLMDAFQSKGRTHQ